MEPEEVWRSDLDPDHLWRGTPDPNRLQPASHPWSYTRTAMAGKQRREAKATPEPVVNKPSPRRERRTGRRRAEVRSPVGQAARNADVTHCPRGHEYTTGNTYAHYTKRGWRQRRCRTCALDAQAAKRAAQPAKAERVGPRGAAALALLSPTCRRGHPWDQTNTVVRGGNSSLTGTRLCKACRDARLSDAKHEKWRAEMNARADAERERNEAEHRAFTERREELVRQAQVQQMAERKARPILHRWSPNDPGFVRVARLSPRALRLEG